MSGYLRDVFGEVKLALEYPYQYRPRPTKFKSKDMQRKAALFSSAKQDWQTPIWLYEHIKKLREIDNYDTDPASNEGNPLNCKHYYTEKRDGLDKPWFGRAFINPPFGWGYYKGHWTYLTGLWIDEAWHRIFNHETRMKFKLPDSELRGEAELKLVTLLVPSRTSPIVYHKYCWDYEHARPRKNVVVNFFPKRVKFGNATHTAPFDTMIIDFIHPSIRHKFYIQ